MTSEVAIRPAATVACLRDGRRGLEVLLVRRSASLVFHGGAWVFPGGAVEGDDASAENPESVEAATRAAVRESREEVGLVLREDALVALSHWTTPPGRTRRFATYFFLSDVRGEPSVEVDGRELDAHRWLSPADALMRHRRGELELPPPTFVTLSWLSRRAEAAEALAVARASTFERFVPRIAPVPAGAVSLYHGDAGYASVDPSAAGARHRLWMLGTDWRYERL